MDLGLTLTIIFGVISLFGIFLGWKAWNRPKLTMVAGNSTILANLTQSASGISVKYENEDVSKNLILISVYIINNGNSDIDVRDVEQPVTIVLPTGSKWLSFKVIANKHEMFIKESYNDNELRLNVGLWKKREGFKFDSLISLESDGKIYDKNEVFDCFTIKSRIKELNKIGILHLPKDKKYKVLRTFVFPFIALVLYGFLGISMYFGWGNTNKYKFEIYKDKQELVLKTSNDTPKVYSRDKVIDMTEKDFYDVQVKIAQVSVRREEKLLGISTVLLGVFAFILLIYKDVIAYRLKRKLSFND